MDNTTFTQQELADLRTLQVWSRDVFEFAYDTMEFKPAEPLDELKGAKIPFQDAFGNKYETELFDIHGNLVYHDLNFYQMWMFKDQEKAAFRAMSREQKQFTWQQTVVLEGYNRAIKTFDKDAFDIIRRWLTTRSGHGIGKTACMSVIALHFLICFPGAQVGMTANTEQQVQDIFLKELYVWKSKMEEGLGSLVDITSDHVRIDEDSEDWFLRAQVARPERPEALAGLHGEYVLILVDEASGVSDKVFEVMKGALTGDNYIVVYFSNPTRNEGEFYDSHKPSSLYTKLHFSSRESPIVKDGFIEKMEADYPGTGEQKSDEVLIRVDGEFAGEQEMDDKGWIPLLANINVHFEPEQGQIINGGIIGVDPAGQGRDRAIAHIRDNIYLKEVMNDKTSTPKDGARKVETIRDAYNCSSNDIGIDAFGIGAKWVAEIHTKMGESVNALLTDKPREETKHLYASYKAELAWLFRAWLANGGIIITNYQSAWMKELEKIKYKRDRQGRIVLMDKVTFKKEYNFSPDRFDAAIHTFFKENPNQPVIKTKQQLETEELKAFINKARAQMTSANPSSM